MGEIAPMIKDLSLILMVAGVVTLIFKKLKQPLVLGYIVAGYLVGNHMPYFDTVTDNANVKLWGDIGVIFLLFSLGLDFSFKKIVKMGSAPIITVLCTIAAMITLGLFVGSAFGWSRMDCIFLGGMLAMSSTTIIYKAYDDLGISKQRFAGLVMSVLILEDILAIVMMVMLSTLASGKELSGDELFDSIMNIGFYLALWLIVGIFAIPWFFEKAKSIMNDEVMLVVSLGLCCFMAVVSTEVGFSSAFGAFIMGSILAETHESKYIEELITPVKNLFGAIFFVSVGMLVDPQILVDYAGPIITLVLTIIIGQCVLGTISYMLGGESLQSGMRCGFSMTQIGEFSFIIASLGLSLGVISGFLYPVVVAVSVITTFTTPYMIRLAEPCYGFVSRMLPAKILSINADADQQKQTVVEHGPWPTLISNMVIQTIAWGIVASGILGLVEVYAWPALEKQFPGSDFNAEIIATAIALVLAAPFLWGYAMNNIDSEEFRKLWAKSGLNKFLLSVIVIARAALVLNAICWLVSFSMEGSKLAILGVGIVILAVIVFCPPVKNISNSVKNLFLKNLRAKEV